MNKRVVFLDRDGVINRDPGPTYVTRWEEFEFLPRALEAIRFLTEGGFNLFIVSNQAGVGRGLFDEARLEEITRRMLGAVAESGGKILGVAYCTHTPEAGCACRKPKTGLFEKLARDHSLGLAKAAFVGDTRKDLEAGRALGLRTVLVLSGKASRQDLEQWPVRPDAVCQDLFDAARWITQNGEAS